MSLPETVYRKHKIVKEPFFLDSGEQLQLVAVEGPDGSMVVGFMSLELYKSIEREPHEKRIQVIEETPLFRVIVELEIIKKGWFALNRVCAITHTGEHLFGKTDKGFSELILREWAAEDLR